MIFSTNYPNNISRRYSLISSDVLKFSQLQGLIEDARMQIHNLKHAQEAQLEREKELESRNLEVQHLRQLVPKYRSRLRALEV